VIYPQLPPVLLIVIVVSSILNVTVYLLLVNLTDPGLLAFLKSRQKKNTFKTENGKEEMETEDASSFTPEDEINPNKIQSTKQTTEESMEFKSMDSNQSKHVTFDDSVEIIKVIPLKCTAHRSAHFCELQLLIIVVMFCITLSACCMVHDVC